MASLFSSYGLQLKCCQFRRSSDCIMDSVFKFSLNIDSGLIRPCFQRINLARLWFNILSVYCSTFYQVMVQHFTSSRFNLQKLVMSEQGFTILMVAAFLVPYSDEMLNYIFLTITCRTLKVVLRGE